MAAPMLNVAWAMSTVVRPAATHRATTEGARRPWGWGTHRGCSDVECSLGDEHRRQACGHAPRHHRRGVHGYLKPGQRDKTESGDHDAHPAQTRPPPPRG